MPLVDWIYVVLLLVGATVYEYLYFWPRFRAAVAAEHAGARLRAYRRGVIGQWLFAGAALAIWATHGRSRELLGLVTPHGWRLGLGIGVVLAVFGLSDLYQGRNGAIKATLAGAVMAGIVLATGSLIPAMIARAVIDIGGGTVGYLLLRDQLLSGSAAPAASASRIQGG